MPDTYTLREAAERVAVSPSTLKRWGDTGMIPELRRGGAWTPAAVSHARIVARLRERGHGLEQIRRAGRQGRLAYSYFEALFGADGEAEHTLRDASADTGLEPALIDRAWTTIGLPRDELEALRYAASVLGAGLTLYRDGDYFGREINLASRVVARARGGEVLVTDSVVDAVGGSPHLRFEGIGEVKLKGFDEPRRLCRATRKTP